MELMCQFVRPEFMGFTVQGPAKQAIEQKLEAVQRRLRETYRASMLRQRKKTQRFSWATRQ